MTRRALILGAAGQLGRELCATAPANVAITAVDAADGDIRDRDAVARLFRESKPDVVINCAAFTNVDGAESAKDEAMATNGVAPGVIAEHASAVGARFLHLSTDYVFNGKAHTPYATDAAPGPLNVYGETKLEGERRVLAVGGKSAVVRTAWLHSGTGTNFVNTAVRVLGSGSSMQVVDDQLGTPTRANHLAMALWRLADRPEVTGVLHFTDAGVASWYDVAVTVLNTLTSAGQVGRGAAVEPIESARRKMVAQRPLYSVLNKHDSWRAIDYVPPHWRDGVVASTLELLDA